MAATRLPWESPTAFWLRSVTPIYDALGLTDTSQVVDNSSDTADAEDAAESDGSAGAPQPWNASPAP